MLHFLDYNNIKNVAEILGCQESDVTYSKHKGCCAVLSKSTFDNLVNYTIERKSSVNIIINGRNFDCIFFSEPTRAYFCAVTYDLTCPNDRNTLFSKLMDLS
jgi:hypothetical protein